VLPRVDVVRGTAAEVTVPLEGGTLLAGLGRGLGEGALVVDLAGLRIVEGVYVQPAESRDADHAAWYSAERQVREAVVRAGVAMVGWRDGAVFAHAHALWEEEGRTVLGHLLNDRVRVAAGVMRGLAFAGGRLVQAPDPETNFPLFRAKGEGVEGEAALLTVRPHEEIGAVVADVARGFGWPGVAVMGLGSLIGARFRDGARAMESPISEMLVIPGATGRRLGVATVDLAGEVFEGVLAEGGGEVCVTAELLLRKIPWSARQDVESGPESTGCNASVSRRYRVGAGVNGG
jgi:hypothetical protein